MAQHKVKIFLPCHFDLSQVETCAPFLDRYGGVVFVYDWNVAKDKITNHYKKEYPDGWVQVVPFSLKNILQSIRNLDNTPRGSQSTRKGSEDQTTEVPQVVFLLTGSMNPDYGVFGITQKAILLSIKDALPDRVKAVNVIGHCMYGCASCSGVEHKVPLYFTRYFNKSLPYTAASILKEYTTIVGTGVQQGREQQNQLVQEPPEFRTKLPMSVVSAGAKPRWVLVAPSCGSTSMIAQRPLIRLFNELEKTGEWRFVFKMHPSSLSLNGYDENDETGVEQAELENVKYILENFVVTKEDHPCLLPFMEAFEIVITDLHSSVPFMATFFTPKIILSYFNDADYGTPERHQAFMDQLHTFVEPSELAALLENLPVPKGDPSFFHSQYGHVDGQEDVRFGNLAGWPTEFQKDLPPIKYCQVLTTLARDWKYRYERTVQDYPDDEEGAKNALGFDGKFPLLDGEPIEQEYLPKQLKAQPETALSLMSFNIWNGGLSGSKDLQDTANVIICSGADIVGLQECSTVVNADGKRTYMLPELIQYLPTGWVWSDQRVDDPTGGRNPWGILSRYPIVETTRLGFGVKILLPEGKSVWVFNCHLYYFPYQPFQLCKIPYDDQPFLDTEEEAIESCKAARGKELELILHEIQKVKDEYPEVPIFLIGDLNEPSCLDWTPLSVMAGLHPLQVRWPSSLAVQQLGFVDLWRAFEDPTVTIENKKQLNVIQRPGFSWTTLKTEMDSRDHYDRIDYIFALKRESSPVGLVQPAEMIGESQHVVGYENDVVVQPWPSDHRAVLAKVVV